MSSGFCAPNNDNKFTNTCFGEHELIEIAMAFNQSRSGANIPIRGRSKEELWSDIYARLSNVCTHEACWIEQKFIKHVRSKALKTKLLNYTFKPKMPSAKHSWLSTSDINSVLKQYMLVDYQFLFLGALPADFYKVMPFSYGTMQLYKRIGCVLNLDTHDKGGSHWVALFVDRNSQTIEYFDSVGDRPNKWISKFIRKLLDNLEGSWHVKINSTVHQLENSECGIYAIYYIIQRLMGKSFEQITSHVIRDRKMNRFRKLIFRPPA